MKSANSKFILCILLFCKFLMYFIYFLCISLFLWYIFFCNLILINFKIYIENCANGPKDRINTVLVHFKKISNFHVFCTQTYAKCGFGQILGRRASTKRHVTSRPMVRFSQSWYQKMRKTWKKKVTKRRVAICGGREAVADFVQGGVKLTPPPS